MPRPDGDRPSLRRVTRILRVALAIAIAGTLLHWVGPSEVWARIAACPPHVALIGLAGALLGQWLGAMRFQLLADATGLPLTRMQALGINLSTVFYGLWLPGGTATSWIVRLLRLPGAQRQLGLALMVIAADRAFATAAGAVIGVAADMALHMPATATVPIILALVALGSGCVGWATLSPGMWPRLSRWPGVRSLNGFKGQALPYVATRPAGASVDLVHATVLSIGVHVVGILVWWMLARTLGLDLGLLEVSWVRSAALVVGLLPVTVGGLGLREGTVVALLTTFGVPPADALSLSLLAFVVTVLGVGVVGGAGEVKRMLQWR